MSIPSLASGKFLSGAMLYCLKVVIVDTANKPPAGTNFRLDILSFDSLLII